MSEQPDETQQDQEPNRATDGATTEDEAAHALSEGSEVTTEQNPI